LTGTSPTAGSAALTLPVLAPGSVRASLPCAALRAFGRRVAAGVRDRIDQPLISSYQFVPRLLIAATTIADQIGVGPLKRRREKRACSEMWFSVVHLV
jgi:hypothetical protein